MKKLLAFFSFFTATSAMAGVTLTNCVIAEPALGAKHAALYFTATFTMDAQTKALRLPGAEAIVGADVHALSNRVQIHNSVVNDGVASMQHIAALKLTENAPVILQRGGKHMMLMDLKKRPVAGETYPINVWMTYLENATCEADVIKMPAKIAANS